MTRARRAAVLLLVGYSVFLAWALFWPSSTYQSSGVLRVQVAIGHLHLPQSIGHLMTYEHLEFVMNGVIVAPLTFLASLVFPSLSWRGWTTYAFLASSAVETVQAVCLPGRQAAFSDVVANTAGALVGAAVVAAGRSMLRTSKTP